MLVVGVDRQVPLCLAQLTVTSSLPSPIVGSYFCFTASGSDDDGKYDGDRDACPEAVRSLPR